MPRQYSLKTFLRQTSGPLLNQCLARHGITGVDLGRTKIKPAVVDEMHVQLTALPPEQLKALEADFMAITELASQDGMDAILREARNAGLDFTREFRHDGEHSDYDRACWAFLKYPAIFDRAACFGQIDQIGDQRWNRRFVGVGFWPNTTMEGLSQLRSFMQRSFAREDRGRHCLIDYYLRRDPDRHCFFAYPEDRPSSNLGYNEHGELDQHIRRSAFEVIFVYRPVEGVLEIVAPGGKRRVEDLAACFCTSVLALPEYYAKILRHSYDLSILKSPGLQLPTDPRDRIASVLIRELCLTLPRCQGWRRRLILDADKHSNPTASLHDLILESIRGEGLSIAEVRVSSAKFCFVFEPVDDRRPRRLRFTVAADHCTLKDNPHDQIARKHLRRWGIDPDAASQKIPA